MCQLFGLFSFDMSSIRHVKNRHFVPYSPEDLAGEEWSDDSSCCLLVTSLLYIVHHIKKGNIVYKVLNSTVSKAKKI